MGHLFPVGLFVSGRRKGGFGAQAAVRNSRDEDATARFSTTLAHSVEGSRDNEAAHHILAPVSFGTSDPGDAERAIGSPRV